MHREVCQGQRHGHAGSQALCCTPLCSQAPASTGTAAATAGDPRRHCPCGRGRLDCPLSAGPGSPTLFLCLKHWTVPHGGAGKAARGRGVLLPLPSSKRQASAGLTTPRTQHGKPEASFCHTRSPPPVGCTAPHQGMPPSCTAPRLLGDPGHQPLPGACRRRAACTRGQGGGPGHFPFHILSVDFCSRWSLGTY